MPLFVKRDIVSFVPVKKPVSKFMQAQIAYEALKKKSYSKNESCVEFLKYFSVLETLAGVNFTRPIAQAGKCSKKYDAKIADEILNLSQNHIAVILNSLELARLNKCFLRKYGVLFFSKANNLEKHQISEVDFQNARSDLAVYLLSNQVKAVLALCTFLVTIRAILSFDARASVFIEVGDMAHSAAKFLQLILRHLMYKDFSKTKSIGQKI